MKKITKVERHRVMAYVSELMPLLGLSHCEVLVLKKPCDGAEADATIATMPDTRRGLLSLSDEWMSFGPRRKTRILIHELLHLVTAPLCQEARTDDMSKDQRTSFNTAEEVMVDTLAASLACLLPQYPGNAHSISPNVYYEIGF